jgi:hypothetical protein
MAPASTSTSKQLPSPAKGQQLRGSGYVNASSGSQGEKGAAGNSVQTMAWSVPDWQHTFGWAARTAR